MIPNPRRLAVLAFASLFAACSSAPKGVSPTPDADGWLSEFHVAPNDLASQGSNPFFVLEPGYTLVLESKGGKKKEQLVVTVLADTELVDGVETRVVEERETVDGKLKEVSRNYFAISKRTGDVYYFGEDVDVYENGAIASHEGAWRSGVDGARYGLVMPGTVRVGAKYYQEHAPGKAMDRFEIVSTDAALDTPGGRFEHCLKVEETNALEAGEKEYKHYAQGVGLIQDEDLLLVQHGSTEPGPWPRLKALGYLGPR